jgi:hypothetical protein
MRLWHQVTVELDASVSEMICSSFEYTCLCNVKAEVDGVSTHGAGGENLFFFEQGGENLEAPKKSNGSP